MITLPKIQNIMHEPIASAEFKLSVALLFKNLNVNYLGLHLFRLIDSPRFINISAVPSEPFFLTFDIEFF